MLIRLDEKRGKHRAGARDAAPGAGAVPENGADGEPWVSGIGRGLASAVARQAFRLCRPACADGFGAASGFGGQAGGIPTRAP